jgi:tRNA(Ile)-lysidine synthase
MLTPDFLDRFPELWRGKTLVAISGGMDSVALAHLFHESGLDFALAHANFGLRGDESDGDEALVRGLAAQWCVELYLRRFTGPEFAELRKLGTQGAARQLRYQWFEDLCRTNGYARVATAHHLDDNIETLLFHLIRGTGIHGLLGIPTGSGGTVLRPFNELPRAAIRAYAEDRGLVWREDSSNASEKYARNAIRHRLVPLLRELYPSLDATMRDNMARWRETAHLFDESVEKWRREIVEETAGERRLLVEPLLAHPACKTLLHGFLSDRFSSDLCVQAEHLLRSQTGAFVENATHRLYRDRAHLVLVRKSDEPLSSEHRWEENTFELEFAHGLLRGEKVLSLGENDRAQADVVLLPLGQLQFPLTLRRWKSGDRFCPYGMKGRSQKVSDWLTNAKISPPEKERVFVLCSGDDICWLVGHRTDQRFANASGTGPWLRIAVVR